MWGRNAPDRHVFWPACSYCTDLTITYFVPLLQELREISKTRNQFFSKINEVATKSQNHVKSLSKTMGETVELAVGVPHHVITDELIMRCTTMGRLQIA